MGHSLLKEIVAFRETGHSYGDIAARLGITRNAVAGALFRAGLVRKEGPKSLAKRGFGKLTESDVRYIRAAHIPRHGMFGASALAKNFGVSSRTVDFVLQRKTWAHVQ